MIFMIFMICAHLSSTKIVRCYASIMASFKVIEDIEDLEVLKLSLNLSYPWKRFGIYFMNVGTIEKFPLVHLWQSSRYCCQKMAFPNYISVWKYELVHWLLFINFLQWKIDQSVIDSTKRQDGYSIVRTVVSNSRAFAQELKHDQTILGVSRYCFETCIQNNCTNYR